MMLVIVSIQYVYIRESFVPYSPTTLLLGQIFKKFLKIMTQGFTGVLHYQLHPMILHVQNRSLQ